MVEHDSIRQDALVAITVVFDQSVRIQSSSRRYRLHSEYPYLQCRVNQSLPQFRKHTWLNLVQQKLLFPRGMYGRRSNGRERGKLAKSIRSYSPFLEIIHRSNACFMRTRDTKNYFFFNLHCSWWIFMAAK